MGDKESDDPRVNHIKITVLNLLNTDESYWDELIWKEENQAIIKDFLDTPPSILLFVYFDHNNKLALSLEIPTPKNVPKIISYFMKNNIVISAENYKNEIMHGNLSNLPLSQYHKLFGKVLFPLFANLSNNSRWPLEITKDIILHLQDFREILTYHVGVAQGRTVLIMSESAKMIEDIDIDSISSDSIDEAFCNVINSITDMLCDWIPVVREVLELTSEEILSKAQQGPITEIKFWNDRKINLQFIQKQLNNPLIKKMILALEKTNNCHFQLFKTLLQDVSEGLDEATEISDSLTAMSDELQKLKDCEFSKLKEYIPSAMKVITSSWTDSKYFNPSPSRISVLIQKMCNLLIEKIQNYLIPIELFKNDQSEMKKKVKISIDTCNVFLESYHGCEANASEGSIYPWKFPDKRVFDRFENFLDRLNKVHEIFEAFELYISIPEYKILGIQQVPFKMRLEDLTASFKVNYRVFSESTYNPLDIKCSQFLENCHSFFQKIDEFDHKLGIALAQACLTSVTSEDSFKLMNAVEGLLKRPVVNMEFKRLISSLIRNIYMELLAAEESYHNLQAVLESENNLMNKHLPSTSGALQWSIDLQKKLSFPVNSLQNIEHQSIKADDIDLILETYKNMEDLLSNFQTELFGDWQLAFDTVNEKLEETLFISDNEIHMKLNFSPELLDISEEIRYIKLIKKDNLLPADVLGMYESLKAVLLAQSLLACTSRWYNDLIDNLVKYEKALVKDEWEKICNDIKQGLNEKWTKSGLEEYAENIYKTTKSLFERINQAKENIREVQKFIESWNKTPIVVRSTPDSLVNFEMFMTPKMRQQIYYAKETYLNMCRIMEENILLFSCNTESEEWKNYVSYLESIILTGLKKSVKCSLEYLFENTYGENKKLIPFYKVNMILKDDISFIPPLDSNQQGSLQTLLDTVIDYIYMPAAEIFRMSDSEKNYLGDLMKDSELNDLKSNVIYNVQSGIEKILTQLKNYQHYADLWLQNIDSSLEDFILYGPVTDVHTEEGDDMTDLSTLEIKPPTEEEFRTQITQFDMLQRKVEDVSEEIQVESWLILDVSPFKESLLMLIRNWASAYKKKLVELKSQGKLRKLEDDGDA